MSTQQKPEQSPELRWGISREELRRRERKRAKPVDKNEHRCPECNSRVTKTPSGTEVGHDRGRKQPMCPNHPDSDAEPEQQSLTSNW